MLTSAQNTASNPASSAARATSWISPARHPVPGISPSPNRSAIVSSPVLISPTIGSRAWCSLRRFGQSQQAAGQHEMRLVDHPAVEREGAGIRVGGKGGNDALGPLALGGADRKRLV